MKAHMGVGQSGCYQMNKVGQKVSTWKKNWVKIEIIGNTLNLGIV